MTYREAVSKLREPLADISWSDNLKLPYGRYKGVRLTDLYQLNKEYFRWYKECWLNKTISKNTETYNEELVFAQSLIIIWNENYCTEAYSINFEQKKGGLCFE